MYRKQIMSTPLALLAIAALLTATAQGVRPTSTIAADPDGATPAAVAQCPHRSTGKTGLFADGPAALLLLRDELQLGPRQIERLVEIRDRARCQARNLLTAEQREKLAAASGECDAASNLRRLAAGRGSDDCSLFKTRLASQQVRSDEKEPACSQQKCEQQKCTQGKCTQGKCTQECEKKREESDKKCEEGKCCESGSAPKVDGKCCDEDDGTDVGEEKNGQEDDNGGADDS